MFHMQQSAESFLHKMLVEQTSQMFFQKIIKTLVYVFLTSSVGFHLIFET